MNETLEVAVPVTTVWTSPDAPRDLDEAAVRDRPDAAAWADSMDKQVRLGLHGRTETQLLAGDPVEVVETAGDWSRVVARRQRSSRDERGYPGWVRSAHLDTPVDRVEGPTAYVAARTATCLVDGDPVVLSFGTVLWLRDVTDRSVTVDLPGGRTGTLEPSAVRLREQAEQPSYDAGPVVEAARGFLGVRYLWGGTSAWGLDCSGLVHLSWRSQGVLLPRDAHDQAASPHVEPVPLDAVQPGDLYFFATPGRRIDHVGFVTSTVGEDGSRRMLHAPEGDELIEDALLAPHRLETLASAGRVHA